MYNKPQLKDFEFREIQSPAPPTSSVSIINPPPPLFGISISFVTPLLFFGRVCTLSGNGKLLYLRP